MRQLPVRPHRVLYSTAGGAASGDPEALFRALLAAPGLGHLRHTWALARLDPRPDVAHEFAGHERVSFVPCGSPLHLLAVRCAGYLVTDGALPAAKRPGQVYVHTGGAAAGDLPVADRSVADLSVADFLVSANGATTRQIRARVGNAFAGAVVEEGAPRLDRQVLDDAGRAAVRRRLVGAGVGLWPGERIVGVPPGELAAQVGELQAELGGTPWRVVPLGDLPADLPVNLVLGVTDALVACPPDDPVQDFAATGRPVVFVAGESGEAPGPVVATAKEAAGLVRAIGTGTHYDPAVSHAAARAAWRARVCPHADGHAGERVAAAVFGLRQGT